MLVLYSIARVHSQDTKHEENNEKTGKKNEASLSDNTPPSLTSPNPLLESSKGSSNESGVVSSTSPRDDQEFILEGLDFSSGLSICHALASDSDDEEDHIKTTNNKFPQVADKQELTSALRNILQVQGDHPESFGKVPPLRAMTLDEIEEPRPPASRDQDQTAFNKFLATMKSSRDVMSTGIEQEQVWDFILV